MSEDFMRDVEGSSGPPPLPPPMPPVVYSRPPKNPAAATLLSLFPGLGQVYNGQPAKALVFFVAWTGSIWAAAGGHEMPFALMIPFIHLYNMVDAWRSASLINRRAAGGARVAEEDDSESPAWGVTLMLLGFVLLLRNLGWIDFAALTRYWPLVLIVAGGALLYGSLQRKGNGGHARL